MVDEAVIEAEQEQLRNEMDESRLALVQKIEQLENKVTETVQTATATVADATATVMETVQNATSTVSETVDTVTSAVQGTVDTVRQSVEGTVDTVKDTFDVTRQVQRHPWLMMAGAVAVGYFVERLLISNNNRPPRPMPVYVPPRGVMEEGASSPLDERPYQPFSEPSQSPVAAPVYSQPQAAQPTYATPPTPQPGFTDQLVKLFAPEVTKLQNLVLGMAMSAVRDAVVPSVPSSFQQPVNEIFTGFTEKLGGQLAPSAGAAKTADVQSAINELNDA